MTYRVVLRKSDEGVSASVPGLPGCWSQGATEVEALDNIRDAIQEYLTAMEDLLKDIEAGRVLIEEEITAELNAVYAKEDSSLPDDVVRMQAASIGREEW
jgi:predicted RNase H-like HicB family nuclease